MQKVVIHITGANAKPENPYPWGEKDGCKTRLQWLNFFNLIIQSSAKNNVELYLLWDGDPLVDEAQDIKSLLFDLAHTKLPKNVYLAPLCSVKTLCPNSEASSLNYALDKLSLDLQDRIIQHRQYIQSQLQLDLTFIKNKEPPIMDCTTRYAGFDPDHNVFVGASSKMSELYNKTLTNELKIVELCISKGKIKGSSTDAGLYAYDAWLQLNAMSVSKENLTLILEEEPFAASRQLARFYPELLPMLPRIKELKISNTLSIQTCMPPFPISKIKDDESTESISKKYIY